MLGSSQPRVPVLAFNFQKEPPVKEMGQLGFEVFFSFIIIEGGPHRGPGASKFLLRVLLTSSPPWPL